MFTLAASLALLPGPAFAAEPGAPEIAAEPGRPAAAPDLAALEASFGPPSSDTPLDGARELRWTAYATEVRDGGRGTPTVAGDGTRLHAVPGALQAPAIVRHRCDILAVVNPDGTVRRLETRGYGCEKVLSRQPAGAGGPELRPR